MLEAKYEPWNYEATEIRATDKNNSDYASCVKLSKTGMYGGFLSADPLGLNNLCNETTDEY